jgi:hypothetical protein
MPHVDQVAYLYGHDIRYSAERGMVARTEADILACKAWNMRMGYEGAAVQAHWSR